MLLKSKLFKERSLQPELIDLGPGYYTHDEYINCLEKLFQVSRIFGFFRNTVKILKNFSTQSSLLDVGCGGGLFLLHLSKLFPTMPMHGIDISSAAIEDAQRSLQNWQEKTGNLLVTFELQEQKKLNIERNTVDIILVTLVCHHLLDDELVCFIKDVYSAANKAVIINDLHRHPAAYFFYKIISPVLFRNRLITHDGLISILRGFTRAEWQLLLHKANIKNYKLKWCFPFRWSLVLMK